MKSVLIVMKFYAMVLSIKPWYLLLAVCSGLMARILAVAAFVLTVKVFLEVIRPGRITSSLELGETFLESIPIVGEIESYTTLLIIILLLVITFQLLISRVNLFISNVFISSLVKVMCIRHNFLESVENKKFALAQLPAGIQASVRALEIICFYIILFSAIYYISPSICVAMLLFVPPMLGLLIFLNKKNISLVTREKNLKNKMLKKPQLIDEYLKVKSQQRSISSNNVSNARFLGSMAITLMILVYIYFGSNANVDSLKAIILVFSVRFVVIYAGELSRLLNKLFLQRNIIHKINL